MQFAGIAVVSALLLFADGAEEGVTLRRRLSKPISKTCTEYTVDNKAEENASIHRSARIDFNQPGLVCSQIASFQDGKFGATFCNMDTFGRGPQPLVDEHGDTVGVFTRIGSRVVKLDNESGPLIQGGVSTSVYAFNDAEDGNLGSGSQIITSSLDIAGSAKLVSAITGGTGAYLGVQGEVSIESFFDQVSTITICILD